MSVKADFELGQLAHSMGKHHSNCPFKLPHRKAAWQRGYRDATYENPTNIPLINTESTHGHIINLRKILRITMATTNIRNNLASYAQLKKKAQECSSLKPQKKMNYAEQAMEVMELVIIELVNKVEGIENESCTTR